MSRQRSLALASLAEDGQHDDCFAFSTLDLTTSPAHAVPAKFLNPPIIEAVLTSNRAVVSPLLAQVLPTYPARSATKMYTSAQSACCYWRSQQSPIVSRQRRRKTLDNLARLTLIRTIPL